MKNSLLLGLCRWLWPVPPVLWRRELAAGLRRIGERLRFMTEDHRRVRNYAVCRLAASGAPVAPAHIADRLHLAVDRVKAVFDDFEKHLIFFLRNEEGAVLRLFPVTVEKTPHRLVLSTGDEPHATDALGALAVPFVQGQLRGIPISGHITTVCAYCGNRFHILIDSDVACRVVEKKAGPLVFLPAAFIRPGKPRPGGNYSEASVFFCSEEHAREHRRRHGGKSGVYFTLEQAARLTPALQRGIFDLPAGE